MLSRIKENQILQLAIPATVENVLQTLVGFIDTLMIAKIGLLAVTAVGIANTILSVYLAVFIALGVGASALIAQMLGAKEIAKAKTYTQQALILSLVVSLFFSLISLFFAPTILRLMGADQESLPAASEFLMIVGGASGAIALMTVLGSLLRATGDTKSPMKISVIVNLVNIATDYFLIFHLQMGVVGTAIGTVLSRVLGMLLLFYKLQQSEIAIEKATFFKKSSYHALIQLAIPATLERLVMRMGQVVYFSLIVAIGAKTFAAHSIAGNIESFAYMPAYGLATAATTLIGYAVGEKDIEKARLYAKKATRYGVVILAFFGIILFFGGEFFATFFTKDAVAIKEITIALKIDAFIQPALAFSLIMTGALQGAGDTKSPLYSTAFGVWIIRMLGVLLLARHWQMGIAGVWLSIGIDLYLRSIFLNYRFKRTLQKLT
ncbi:putative MATE family efflux protein [Enterococcus sp. PF1-24]|uniref:MATE family efflux transporter n=1 Tax=unclassified Enterococcus TaxID=2608891 RepID=UPI0024751AEA|nr:MULTISPECIES: MATE family efflux transporter [unclassified Enterococcus]MDH6365710.1 putative MATE family efflux protein [Enterococcus sp. PFB1-1]MDH6402810.1 putative MATE family efflux protein [Enterococcus sp. PF1-24]